MNSWNCPRHVATKTRYMTLDRVMCDVLQHSDVWCHIAQWCVMSYSTVWCVMSSGTVWCVMSYRTWWCVMSYESVMCDVIQHMVMCDVIWHMVLCDVIWHIVMCNVIRLMVKCADKSQHSTYHMKVIQTWDDIWNTKCND